MSAADMSRHAAGVWNDDPLYGTAVKIAQDHKRITCARLQRTLFIGFNRASRLLEEMERRGVVKIVTTEDGGRWQLVA